MALLNLFLKVFYKIVYSIYFGAAVHEHRAFETGKQDWVDMARGTDLNPPLWEHLSSGSTPESS